MITRANTARARAHAITRSRAAPSLRLFAGLLRRLAESVEISALELRTGAPFSPAKFLKVCARTMKLLGFAERAIPTRKFGPDVESRYSESLGSLIALSLSLSSRQSHMKMNVTYQFGALACSVSYNSGEGGGEGEGKKEKKTQTQRELASQLDVCV